MSQIPHFLRRRHPLAAGLLSDPTFQQPFNTGYWLTGQSQVGWYLDTVNHLALNDGTYADTQYLHYVFPQSTPPFGFKMVYEVVAHPAGGANFGYLNLTLGDQSSTILSNPGSYSVLYAAHTGSNHLLLLVSGTCRMALKSLQIYPV